jgi:hypothetical protein
MRYRFVSSLVAVLVLSAGAGCTSPPPIPQGGEVEILVNGAPQRRYAHGGRWYVEALKGREYAIRLHNPYPVRVAIALSVDGLNTIDAGHTDAASARKWVLGPYETATISGWQTSHTEARRFEFTTEAARTAGARQDRQSRRDLRGLLQGAPVGNRPRVPNEALPRSAPQAARAGARRKHGVRHASARRKATDEYAATGMGSGPITP